ncbi:MAG: alkaline phosphatase family protein [Candidatus Thermoplasmatota archaeon]|nr:alkaline phosphatase family protein [Candidatus Thermoplasmatota archaeon]
MRKVIVIGIDGADPNLLQKWIGQGRLPTFKKLQEKGSWGKMKSTIPPFSAPAWTSIVTGCSPGKHSIYGFERTGTLEPKLINSRYRKVPAIWNLISSIGKKCIIVNVPGTYPPEEIDGVMITGLLTPSRDVTFTYPKNIKERLVESDLGSYELEQFWLEDFSRAKLKRQDPQALANHINSQMMSRFTVAENLMREISWDFCMVVFRGTDTAQHFLFDNEILLLSCYKKVDELVGKIIENNADSMIFIVSDHGFEQIKKVLYPDNVLYNNKFLVPNWDPYDNIQSLTYSIIYRFLQWVLKKLPKKTLKESKAIKQLLFSSASKATLIEFTKTKAFSTADGRGIQLCLAEKYKNGIVSKEKSEELITEIIALLSSLKDPKDNNLLIEKVYRSEEIFGKDAIDPPDLVFDLKPGVTASEWISFPTTLHEMLRCRKNSIPFVYPKDPAGRTGDHAAFGVFFAYGNNIKANKPLRSIKVEDVLPTVFTSLGLSPPYHIDGNVIKDIFIEKPSVEEVNWLQFTKKPPLQSGEIKKIIELRKHLKLADSENENI